MILPYISIVFSENIYPKDSFCQFFNPEKELYKNPEFAIQNPFQFYTELYKGAIQRIGITKPNKTRLNPSYFPKIIENF